MQENAVVIASKEREAVLYLAEDAPRAVRIACTNFLTDLNKICGCPARMTHDAREANVLVGVIGEDAAVDALAGARYGALKEDGVLRWEAYVQTLLPDGRLVAAGNGRRGAVYGVYDLSRRFGVSPWYFFADVPVKKRRCVLYLQFAVPLGMDAAVRDGDPRGRARFLRRRSQIGAADRPHLSYQGQGTPARRRAFFGKQAHAVRTLPQGAGRLAAYKK